MYLVQTYRMTVLENPSFPALRASVRTTRLTSMQPCQFTSTIASLGQPKDVTQAVGNILSPLSLNIAKCCKHTDLQQ